MLLFFSGGCRKKSYEVPKLGRGGGGGGGLGQKNFFEKNSSLCLNFFFLHFSSHYSNIMMESYCL